MHWNRENPPRGDGKTFAVTGASSGIGLWIALQLARAGAEVVLLGRNTDRAARAEKAVRQEVPSARLSTIRLDTADMASVRTAGAELEALPRLDALVNNAGMLPASRERRTSVDGHELTLATNTLGHFLLARTALPRLAKAGDAARVVWMGSMAAKLVRPTPGDLELEHSYTPWRAYAQSKLLMQALGFEMHRRLTDIGSPVRSLLAHPGYSLAVRAPALGEAVVPGEPTVTDRLQFPLAQGQDRGAWAAVRATLDSEALGGQFYGPRGGLRGEPVLSGASAGTPGEDRGGLGSPGWRSTDPRVGAAAWEFASRACGLGPEL